MPDLLDHRTADYLRTLAPRDLAGVPVYAVRQSALPPDRGGLCAFAGITAPTLDLELRDLIGPEWHGRGACFVVNDLYARDINGGHAASEACSVRSVAVHEIAHCLTRAVVFEGLDDARPEDVLEFARDTARLVTDPTALGAGTGESGHYLPPARMHGPAFTRAALHLWHRAGGWGSDLQPRLIVGGYQRLRYAGAKRYLAVLGDELDRLRDASFAELRKLPLPPAFVALWKADAGLAPALPAVPTPCPVPRSYLPDPPDEETTP